MQDDSQPVTQAQFQAGMQQILTAVQSSAQQIRGEIAQSRLEIDVQYETLRHDVMGAIGDMHSLVKDKHADYDQRILRLEVANGFRAR